MAKNPVQKTDNKKPGRTLKEKRAAKKAKHAAKSASLFNQPTIDAIRKNASNP